MAYVFDGGKPDRLGIVEEMATTLHLCTDEPKTYREASQLYEIGSGPCEFHSFAAFGRHGIKTCGAYNLTAHRDGVGRFIAVTDGQGKLLASVSVQKPFAVAGNETFSIAEFGIRERDAP